MMINNDDVKKAKREYYREYRKNNPERIARIQERFWKKKAAEMRAAAAGSQEQKDPVKPEE